MNTFLIYIVLIFWAVTTIYPIFWVISNSFKDKKMIMSDAFSLPLGKLFTTANYTETFSMRIRTALLFQDVWQQW